MVRMRGGGLYNERIEHWGRGRKKKQIERKREIKKNTLREKGEQYYFLGESCFLRSLCVKFVASLYLNTSLIPPL